MPILVFRCDDYSSDGGPLEQVEHAVVELFAAQRLPLIFGVIPALLESRPDKIEFLRPYLQQGLIDIALHGWDHQAQPELLAARGIKSELSGRAYADQKKRLSTGKQKLEEWFGRSVNIFIPPWDSYDLTTLQVCAELGFQMLSADLYSPLGSLQAEPLLLPSTLRLQDLAELLAQSGNSLQQDKSQGSRDTRLAIVEFHVYEFYESGHALANFSFATFAQLVAKAAKCSNIEIICMADAGERLKQEAGNQRYWWAQRVEHSATKLYATRWRNRVGNWVGIPKRRQPSLYEPIQFYRWQETKQQLLYHLPHILLTLAATFAGLSLAKIIGRLT